MEGVQTFNCRGSKLSEEERATFYHQMKNVVVIVDVFNEEAEEYDWEGAGVLVSESGHVLTLSHMLSDNQNARVRVIMITNKGRATYDSQVLSLDKTMGLAILKVSQSNIRFPYANICEDVSIGEEVYPIGHPGYLTFSYPIGHVSYPCREYNALKQSLDSNDRLRNMLEERKQSSMDPSATYVCFADRMDSFHSLCSSVSFIQVNNNVHGRCHFLIVKEGS